ncbi:MAG TPA: YraN family protein [Eoetvoesiella sp.]|uniref:YraN family protein n=1 Tax=Eoetvoesiella sp. TaxID=1966355 RepID=UPI002B834D70|nr:YraN family protein [Eoetvoesiella sp.]HWK62643.1 YraN family protein [Eoetvoesiella sp.]
MPTPDEDATAYACALTAQKKAVRRHKRRQKAMNQNRSPAEPRLSPTQKAGLQTEEQAKAYLEAAGLRVVAQNLRRSTGEIDLVCTDGDTLVFVEVRQRRSSRYGGAAASVNRRKQQRLINTAALLLPALAPHCTPACRFDVIAKDGDELVWIQNAFCAS